MWRAAVRSHVPRADSAFEGQRPSRQVQHPGRLVPQTGLWEGTMQIPHQRQFLHLAAGAAALPAMSRIARPQTYVRIV
jgi:hypothetical protein